MGIAFEDMGNRAGMGRFRGAAEDFLKKYSDSFGGNGKRCYLCVRNRKIARVLSSVGSEHLVYTQRVGGSTPSGPTDERGYVAEAYPLFVVFAFGEKAFFLERDARQDVGRGLWICGEDCCDLFFHGIFFDVDGSKV